MDQLLNQLLHLPPALLWLIFLVENTLIIVLVLFFGWLIQRRFSAVPNVYTSREIQIAVVTNVLNTAVTYAGYWLWKHSFILISMPFSWHIIPDFFLLFFGMDLLMFIFHYFIHKTFLYRAIHQLHHQSVDPRPLDLFILHPIETVSFGGLWLVLLLLYAFNIYAIVIYLVVNVLFGMAGHLGIEPLPAGIRRWPVVRYIGTSTFHHNHHQEWGCNFGFYTSIWDRIMGTYKG